MSLPFYNQVEAFYHWDRPDHSFTRTDYFAYSSFFVLLSVIFVLLFLMFASFLYACADKRWGAKSYFNAVVVVKYHLPAPHSGHFRIVAMREADNEVYSLECSAAVYKCIDQWDHVEVEFVQGRFSKSEINPHL